ncbi:hypothetical protein NQZ68_035730 [Dissostichus eleginoides]|nr:hypothetical protein NQZ68_035730 [Dissostichus eleginoides]
MAVEMALGLIEVSLASFLMTVNTYFRKEIPVIFMAGGWTTLTGLTLLAAGRKPSYCCLKSNMILHLPTVMLSILTFGLFVKHVPYKQVLVNVNLAVLLTIAAVETLVSLMVLLKGSCSMISHPQQPEDPERIGSTVTSEPLCPPAQNHETPQVDAMKSEN